MMEVDGRDGRDAAADSISCLTYPNAQAQTSLNSSRIERNGCRSLPSASVPPLVGWREANRWAREGEGGQTSWGTLTVRFHLEGDSRTRQPNGMRG